jgi:RimJ/RimL family protein N-acetyltransferase
LGLWLGREEKLVGAIDWLPENPSDGHPWIGLVLVHRDWQCRGLASEAVRGYLEHEGLAGVRAGVIVGNEAGRGLVEHLGFRAVDTRELALGGGRHEIVVFEQASPREPAREEPGR